MCGWNKNKTELKEKTPKPTELINRNNKIRTKTFPLMPFFLEVSDNININKMFFSL